LKLLLAFVELVYPVAEDKASEVQVLKNQFWYLLGKFIRRQDPPRNNRKVNSLWILQAVKRIICTGSGFLYEIESF